MYVRFGKNKVSFRTPKDLKNRREIGVFKIRDNYAFITYSQKSINTKYTGRIAVRLPAIASEYADEAFGIGGR